MAALWTEMCLAMPAIHAMGDGYEVYIVTDASGGVSPEATTWQSAAWWLPEFNPLPGSAWRGNFSVIGLAQRASEKSLSFLSTMPAQLVPYSCGRRSCWAPPKIRVPRAKGNTMAQRATTALSLHYHIRPGQREAVLVEIKGILDRCAQEPEFITGIVHETPERPNEFVFYELWKGTRADFDAIQGPKPYRKAYMENVKQFLEKVEVEWNSPILEWGTNLTGLNQS
jgi:quinol monooxygenase YgiN